LRHVAHAGSEGAVAGLEQSIALFAVHSSINGMFAISRVDRNVSPDRADIGSTRTVKDALE
jgi:hypothetical protein